jgi:uncharacterized Zn-finger protein
MVNFVAFFFCSIAMHVNIFVEVADLKKHIKCVVLKQRPFKCDSCDRAFGEKSNLTRHIRAVQYVSELGFSQTKMGRDSNEECSMS